jgi:putative hydrolase of the HAD superfamily
MKIPEEIRNIIFDLGGVLLSADAQLTIQAFRELGMEDLIKPGGWSYGHEVFLDMEVGRITDAEFRKQVRGLLPAPVSDSAIDAAWSAMLTGFSPERIEQLRALRPRYSLYLFSNTNSIHVACFEAMFFRQFGYPLGELFAKTWYSNEIHLRKPALEAFEYVLRDAGLTASETLFVDDFETNVNAAAATGMTALWFRSGDTLRPE